MDASKETLINEIQLTLARMQTITTSDSTVLKNIEIKVEKNSTSVKWLFYLIAFGFALGITIAVLLWSHFKLDERRFAALVQIVTTLQERQDEIRKDTPKN